MRSSLTPFRPFWSHTTASMPLTGNTLRTNSIHANRQRGRLAYSQTVTTTYSLQTISHSARSAILGNRHFAFLGNHYSMCRRNRFMVYCRCCDPDDRVVGVPHPHPESGEPGVERERAITPVLKSKSNAPAALTQSFAINSSAYRGNHSRELRSLWLWSSSSTSSKVSCLAQIVEHRSLSAVVEQLVELSFEGCDLRAEAGCPFSTRFTLQLA